MNVLLTLLLVWIVVTLGSAAGLLAFLAFDEWQVRSRTAVPTARRSDAAPTVSVPQPV